MYLGGHVKEMFTQYRANPIGYSWLCEKLDLEPITELQEKYTAVFDYNAFRSTSVKIPGYIKFYSEHLSESAYNGFDLVDHLRPLRSICMEL